MAEYSGTPTAKKLGIHDGARLLLLQAPQDIQVLLGDIPPKVEPKRSLRARGPFDVILLFCRDAKRLRSYLAPAIKKLATAGGLWIAWPKKSSGVRTDLDSAAVRAAGLRSGLVDNKVCAIDETWSALRFVYRLEDR